MYPQMPAPGSLHALGEVPIFRTTLTAPGHQGQQQAIGLSIVRHPDGGAKSAPRTGLFEPHRYHVAIPEVVEFVRNNNPMRPDGSLATMTSRFTVLDGASWSDAKQYDYDDLGNDRVYLTPNDIARKQGASLLRAEYEDGIWVVVNELGIQHAEVRLKESKNDELAPALVVAPDSLGAAIGAMFAIGLQRGVLDRVVHEQATDHHRHHYMYGNPRGVGWAPVGRQVTVESDGISWLP